MEAYDEEEALKLFLQATEEKRQERIEAAKNPTIRVRLPRPQYDFMHSENLDEIIARAIELGWATNDVQVKRYQMTPETWAYYIEPYENDCECPSLMKYSDYVAPIEDDLTLT